MATDEIAAFIEERAAVEDGIEHEADYVGSRGKGPYLRALARELRDKFNTRSQTSTITDIPGLASVDMHRRLAELEDENSRLARTVDRKDEQMAELQEALEKTRRELAFVIAPRYPPDAKRCMKPSKYSEVAPCYNELPCNAHDNLDTRKETK